MNQVIKVAFALKGLSQAFFVRPFKWEWHEMNGGSLQAMPCWNVCGSKQPPLWVQVGKQNEWTMPLAERDNLIIDRLCVSL